MRHRETWYRARLEPVAVMAWACVASAGCTDGALELWSTRGAASEVFTSEPIIAMDSTFTSSNGAETSGREFVSSGDQTPTHAGSDGASSNATSTSAPFLVDDFEDGDTKAASGLGWWYTQSDTTGQQNFQIEASGDAEVGAFSAHYSGFGFQVWGALLGLDFTPGEGQMDVSDYRALHFRARAGEDSVTQMSARLLDPEGQYAVELELTTEWRDYELAFDALREVDGSPRPFDPTRLTQLHVFIFSSDYFDLWLDDFELR